MPSHRPTPAGAVALLLLVLATSAGAHFGAILPSDDIVSEGDDRSLTLTLAFYHPFEGVYMKMARPRQFGVVVRDQRQDLLASLTEAARGEGSVWQARFRVRRPGDHVFYMEPEPYFEAAEDLFIAHYPKVIVGSMGLEAGWDQEVGLKTEIVPLTRPYGLWTGNVFQGQVKVDGEPVPGAKVEVSFHNEEGLSAPDDAFTTQVVRADQAGVFTCAMPRAGWWGFSALTTSASTMAGPDGRPRAVELGALLWVRTRDLR
ncbi:MAG: DUF4198 domain-containing protein [Gemmatimonadota bacterium]